MHPIRLAPSLLSCDFARLGEEIALVEGGGADWLHLDVMDGHFVPNLTIGPPVIAAIKKVATKPLDVHMMIQDPLRYADAFLDAGADVFTFHLEITGGIDSMRLIEKVKQAGAKVGLALNPDTDPHDAAAFLPYLDLVLLMSVFPGFSGQSFMPDVLAKVGTLRGELAFSGEIEMDGGIGPDTIGVCAAAGVNAFVAGSAVFGAKDVPARLSELREIATNKRSA